ncbi:AMP-binding protein [Microvirga sp. TS319]|uniref:AMP-binding protein n=1 Tax=Microvirga sp. TS319 TaxID=3241165 RepID=UPI00351A135A
MTSENHNLRAALASSALLTPDRAPAAEAQLTLGQVIGRLAALQPQNPAILTPGFAPLSYLDLQSRIDEVRSRLRRGGLSHRARIGVLLPNGPQAVIAIVAIACAAVAVPLDPRLTTAELDQRVGALRLDALLVLQGSHLELRLAAERRDLAIIEAAPKGGDRLSLDLNVPDSRSPAPDGEPAPHDPAFILQTSGTTGRQKLIPFSHANMLAAAARLQAWFGLTPQDRCLSVSPPFYSHGLKVTAFTPLLTGGSIALPADPSSVDLTEWFETLRPTWYSAGPTLHRAVLDKAVAIADIAARHALRFITSGGSPLPQAVRENLQTTLNVPVLEHYGSSEAAQIAADLPPPGPSKPGTCGVPWPGTVAIVDEAGLPLPHGKQGEVWVRGPTLIAGYLDDPELNRSAFVDGWLRTGDLGSIDEDGFLSLHGRLTEVINRGGEKVSPAEIDHALLRHPAVAEAAAFAAPHPRYGEDVAAAVVLHPGASAEPSDLRLFLEDKLTPYKIPRTILVLEQLPKGITGKVQRRQLADLLTAGSDEAKGSGVPSDCARIRWLERELLEIWRRVLKLEDLTVDDDFFERGGDSLLAVEMLLEVERTIGLLLPASVLFQGETIRLLAPKMARQIHAPEGPCAVFNAEGDQPPLFFFLHGDLDTGSLLVRRLVHLLPPDQPIVLIEPHGSRGGPAPRSIEDMAEERLQLILERQPTGPYRIIGSCKGALVAFEVAHLLTQAGQRVEFVGLVDIPTTSAHVPMRLALSLVDHVAPPAALAWVYEQMNRYERLPKMPWGQRLARSTALMAKGRGASGAPLSTLNEIYTPLMARYRPRPLAVPVVYYAAEFDGRRWRRLSPDLTVVELPGKHNLCISVGAEILAGDIRQRFGALARHQPTTAIGIMKSAIIAKDWRSREDSNFRPSV